MEEDPEKCEKINRQLEDLEVQWDSLEKDTKEKGEKLQELNNQLRFSQGCDELDNWITTLEDELGHEEMGGDLVAVNNLLQKQQVGVRCLEGGVGSNGRDGGRGGWERRELYWDELGHEEMGGDRVAVNNMLLKQQVGVGLVVVGGREG